MESIITYPHSVAALHPIFAFNKSKQFFSKSLLNLTEIADRPFIYKHQFPISNFRFDINGRTRPVERKLYSKRSINGDYNDNDSDKSQLSEDNTYNKEEILALLRRIQSSISGESNTSKGKTNSTSAESVLQVLRDSRKQVKGKTSNTQGSTGTSERKNEQKKDERLNSASNVTNISRPPSNFVKRSPIPSAYVENIEDEVKSGTDGEELETMKLVELRELAKSRGIKGYSKFKKGDLIQLLKTL